ITVPCYITNHESDQDLILGNLFLNKLEDYRNINPNKVAGDVPLAPRPKTSQRYTPDMPISKSKKRKKPRKMKLQAHPQKSKNYIRETEAN
ncbi:hypothetical protein H5410_013676, partial [Solanum commersonii]